MFTVDVHTHIYPESYLNLLRERETVPKIRPGSKPSLPERLIILPGEDNVGSTSAGRPVGPEYSSLQERIAFMDKHAIDLSVISLANPWLDFLDEEQAVKAARDINDELVHSWCRAPSAKRRFAAFAVLPTPTVRGCVAEIKRLAHTYPDDIKGVILGTKGAGYGLDDPALEPMWTALAQAGYMAFVHPHYGLGHVYGEQPNGHVLPLAIGFPVETSIAITRLILAGVLERHPALKLLIAHSGGVLPFLAGRLDSCVKHDAHISNRLPHPPSFYLKKLYYDSVSYSTFSLHCLKELLEDSSDKIMFGTDCPFFPPLGDPVGPSKWESVVDNAKAISAALGSDEASGVFGENAARILKLSRPE